MDKSLFLILIAFTFSFRVTSQTSTTNGQTLSYDRNKKYSVESLHFDLAILKDALVKSHPGLYWYQSEVEFENNYLRLKNSIKVPLTETEFYNLISSFVAKIKCGHTDTDMSDSFYKYGLNNFRVFPFGVRIIESKIYLMKNYSTDTSVAPGSEIISINGLNSDSILHFMLAQQWTDGFIQSYNRIEHFFQNILLAYLNYPASYDLKLKDLNGNVYFKNVEALDYSIYESRVRQMSPDSQPNYSPYVFWGIDSLSTGIIKIKSFMGNGFNQFLERTFKTVKSNNYKSLVIDLRGNSGGYDDYPRALYSYIALKEFKFTGLSEMTIDNPNDSIFKYGKLPYGGNWRFHHFYKKHLKPKEQGVFEVTSSELTDLYKKPRQPHENSFKGSVYILTDIKSYSSSSDFCAIACYNKRAKIIGRETGGAYCGNTSGMEFVLNLPRTGLQVYIPLIKIYNAVEVPCGRGIIPDYPVKETVKDIILNKDADLLFTLNLIRGTK